MDSFTDVISSYPTSVYTVVLGIMLVFWIFAILGMFDIDILPGDAGDDVFDGDIEFDAEMPGFIGLLHTLGLTGVPLTLVISIIALLGFILSYFASIWILLPLGSDLLRYLIGTAILAASCAVAIPITAQAIKPMKPLFVKHYAPSKRDYIGHPCVVTSSTVNSEFGIGTVETRGAPLQIDIRTQAGEVYAKGETLRIAEYDPAKDSFEVISEEKFQQLISQ
ncbi:MAG: hypothetical protein ABW098_15815 [Candidatus Thiodiazotropha sp.]